MTSTKHTIVLLVAMLVIIHEAFGVLEDTDKNILGLNLPYGGGLDNELQLARRLLLPQRFYYPKRNSELINSLLALPKNVNNAGK